MTPRVARCSCGKLRVECHGEPDMVAVCHCRSCQRRTGSAFGIAAFFERTAATIVGKTQTYARATDNGHSVEFHFCPACGSTVRAPSWTQIVTPSSEQTS